MDAHKKLREHISALSDGELATSDLELAAAALRAPGGAQTWIAYHRIGDVLRGQQAPEFSADFDARLAERLAAEAPLGRRVAATPEPVSSAASTASTGAVVKAVTTP